MTLQITKTFKKGTYSTIEEFCERVVSLTDGQERYKDLQPQITLVKPLLEAYSSAMIAAADGGKALTYAKVQAKQELLASMDVLVDLATVYAKGDASYAIDAGFDIRKSPVRSNLPLPVPTWNWLKQGVKSGTVEGEVKNFPKGVREIGIMYSYDNWATTNNGTYSTGKKFTLKELDTEKAVEVKIVFHGTYQRKSSESETKRVFVL